MPRFAPSIEKPTPGTIKLQALRPPHISRWRQLSVFMAFLGLLALRMLRILSPLHPYLPGTTRVCPCIFALHVITGPGATQEISVSAQGLPALDSGMHSPLFYGFLPVLSSWPLVPWEEHGQLWKVSITLYHLCKCLEVAVLPLCGCAAYG